MNEKECIAQAYGPGAVVLGQLVAVETVEVERQTFLQLLGETVEGFGPAPAVSLGVESQQFRDFVGALHHPGHQAAHEAVAPV